jgi:hypothetical protein
MKAFGLPSRVEVQSSLVLADEATKVFCAAEDGLQGGAGRGRVIRGAPAGCATAIRAVCGKVIITDRPKDVAARVDPDR